MKFLFDLLPVILFFTTYKIANVYPDESLSLAARWLGQDILPGQAPILLATAVTIAATLVQIGMVWLRHRKVDRMLWASLTIIIIFGGATLLFHDPTFIKWKPTVLYWLFSTILVGSTFLGRNLIQKMLEAQIQLPEAVWSKTSWAWAGFFLVMGILNLYVAYNFSEESWVNFKLFGCTGLTLVFALGQGLFLSKYVEEDAL